MAHLRPGFSLWASARASPALFFRNRSLKPFRESALAHQSSAPFLSHREAAKVGLSHNFPGPHARFHRAPTRIVDPIPPAHRGITEDELCLAANVAAFHYKAWNEIDPGAGPPPRTPPPQLGRHPFPVVPHLPRHLPLPTSTSPRLENRMELAHHAGSAVPCAEKAANGSARDRGVTQGSRLHHPPPRSHPPTQPGVPGGR